MEEDGETCLDCRSWEENIYWTHFRSIHFFQFLHGDFQKQLGVPKKFAENMKNKLGEHVTLKGPSGSSWKVGLVAEEEGLFFKNGWEEFAKDHLLVENDVLMFKYDGHSRFEVLVFDRDNLCEKEAAYFCKRWGHKERERESEVGTKRKAWEGSEVVTETPLPRDTERPPAPAPAGEPSKEETSPTTLKERRIVSRKRILFEEIGNGSSPIVIDQEKTQTPITSPPGFTSTSKEDRVVRRRSARKDPRFRNVYSSKKSTVKSPEQILVVERAQAAMKSESFIVVMQPTHVYKRFYLSVPVEWSDKHLSRCNQSLILRTKEKTWNTRYNYSARNCGGISSGWRNFALDNYLIESDVCLFNLGESMEGKPVLDVTIFRINESVIHAVPEASLSAYEEHL